MKVDQVMSKGVHAVGPYTSIQDAARLMSLHDIGMLPVIGTGGKLLGVVTDRDITVRSLANGLWPHSTIDRIMTMGVETISADADLERAVEVMQDARVGRLVVLGEDGSLLGVVSLGDIVAKGDVAHRIQSVSKSLGRRSTSMRRIPDQFAHIG